MKSNLLITSVLVFFCLCTYPAMAQHAANEVAVGTAAPGAAKCAGATDCKACKNCSDCAHCKDGGKCGVCKKSMASDEANNESNNSHSSEDNDYTKVEWSSKSLRPAATTLQRLNVRSGPGTSFKVVGEVSSEDPLIVIGEREGWYKIVVRHADLVGFVEVADVSIIP